MTVIVPKDQYDAWLDPDNHVAAKLQPILKPYPSDELEYYDATQKVNSLKNNSPENIEAIKK